MEALQLVKQEQFNGITCDFYNQSNQLFMTRSQIGTALEYDNPNDSIRRIHERHKERIDKFSNLGQIDLPSGGTQTTYIYSQRGIFEICRWSRQPKADQFMDWVWDIVEAYRNGELISSKNKILLEPEVKTEIINLINIQLDERLNGIKIPSDYLSTEKTSLSKIDKISIDPIRDTIKPLAELYSDKSVGYNNTYRKVYAAMPVNWNYRKSRYQNVKGNKNKPSKFYLLETDKKLFTLFVDTVNQLISEFTEDKNEF
ncbi:hypothetical protein KQI61_07670 [Anaerocolumna aminovalerica]|uniref:BRO-N domain-containing protein n=1 Tax=Anaerocolumna aminovalerica TaxID=1527 RepID=UPI001C0EEA5A|nr:BRO family protein [Anaerocolumna aminovalerica]MBU5332074.1 hypothetical protein [Anaerocolumna aminovalerica]